jgi:3-oxoadipyl-CoA thiolase
MRKAVIVDAVRTPIGKHGGALKTIRPDDLAAHLLAELVKRNQLDPNLIDDVILGCANQAGEDNRNVARIATLLAGLPVSVSAVTVNRLCGSGLEAVNLGCRAILAGEADLVIAGGVESMTRAPFVVAKSSKGFERGNQTLFDTTLGWRFVNEKLAALYHPYSMGETAENVADKYCITRQDQDEFALLSQANYGRALRQGIWTDEIVPMPIVNRKGGGQLESVGEIFSVDEHPRPDARAADLAKLSPVFKENGTVTAGNSSGINDGAAALLITSDEKARSLNLKPLATFIGASQVGVEPALMGIGPVAAVSKLLNRLDLPVSSLGLIELNEAFASQSIACIRQLNLPADKVNVNGGAIALGHPIGASGARILTTLVYEMRRRDVKYGLATMCIGVGQGIASVVSLH